VCVCVCVGGPNLQDRERVGRDGVVVTVREPRRCVPAGLGRLHMRAGLVLLGDEHVIVDAHELGQRKHCSVRGGQTPAPKAKESQNQKKKTYTLQTRAQSLAQNLSFFAIIFNHTSQQTRVLGMT